MGGSGNAFASLDPIANVPWLYWNIDVELPHGVGIGCWVCARFGAKRDSTWTTCSSKLVRKSVIKQHAWAGLHKRAVSAYFAHMGLYSTELDATPVVGFQKILEAVRRGAIVNAYMPGVSR